MFRKRNSGSGDGAEVEQLLQQDTPLDESEQERIVQEFEEMQLQNSRLWRRMFGAGGLALCAFFLYACYCQITAPWEVKYTGELRTVVTSEQVISMFVLQAAAAAAVAYGLLIDLPKKGDRERACMPAASRTKLALLLGTAGSSVTAVFWSWALHKMVAEYGWKLGWRPDLLWMPTCPLLYCAVCAYVVTSISSTAKEVVALRSSTYRHKKV